MFRRDSASHPADQQQTKDVFVLGGFIQIKTGMQRGASAQGCYRYAGPSELQAALVDACNNPLLALVDHCPSMTIELLRNSIFSNQMSKEEQGQCFPPNKFIMRKYTEAESRQISKLIEAIIEKKPFHQYFQLWCQTGFLAFKTENEAREVAKLFRYVSASDEEMYLPALYRAICLKPESLIFQQYDDSVCCAAMQLQDLQITAGKAIYYGDFNDIEADLWEIINPFEFVKLSPVYITRTVYLLSEPLRLNKGIDLENSNILSAEDLCNAFPNSNTIRIYTTLEAATATQRKTRKNKLVTDIHSLNNSPMRNPIGLDYRPKFASVVFAVELNKAMAFDLAEIKHEINFECIDKSKTAQVINCEKEKHFPAANMPVTIDISGVERQRGCTIC